MFDNKTILEINNTLYIFIKPSFVKNSMQIIHTIYNINLYFLVIYNIHFRILNTLITMAVLRRI